VCVNIFLNERAGVCYFYSMRVFQLLAPLLGLSLLLDGCTSAGHVARPAAEKTSEDPVRITQFYATKPAIPRGEDALLCYGVENATAVRITPPVEQIRPALSRCFTISPKETTTFNLIAEDRSAKTSSQSVTVTVTPPLPHFTDLSISSKEVSPGELVTFCFKSVNAVTVHGGPGTFRLGKATANNCLFDHPRKNTDYRIVIEGAGGETDEAKITVTVR
jgi:hypothetical protein